MKPLKLPPHAWVVACDGRKAVILNPQPSVMTVFETVALGTLIPIATDEAEALSLTAT